jgi:hypothetical protein
MSGLLTLLGSSFLLGVGAFGMGMVPLAIPSSSMFLTNNLELKSRVDLHLRNIRKPTAGPRHWPSAGHGFGCNYPRVSLRPTPFKSLHLNDNGQRDTDLGFRTPFVGAARLQNIPIAAGRICVHVPCGTVRVASLTLPRAIHNSTAQCRRINARR